MYDTNTLLRDAVTAAGLTQTEVARLTGVPQGRISAYINDRHHLTTRQLDRLLEPLGFTAKLSLVPLRQRQDVRRRWLLHRAVAERLRNDPPEGWRERAKQNLERSRNHVHGVMAQGWLNRWEQLLDQDVAEIVEVLLRLGEDEEELRALSPFAGLLTDEERRRVLAGAG